MCLPKALGSLSQEETWGFSISLVSRMERWPSLAIETCLQGVPWPFCSSCEKAIKANEIPTLLAEYKSV